MAEHGDKDYVEFNETFDKEGNVNGTEYVVTFPVTDENGETVMDENGDVVYDKRSVKLTEYTTNRVKFEVVLPFIPKTKRDDIVITTVSNKLTVNELKKA